MNQGGYKMTEKTASKTMLQFFTDGYPKEEIKSNMAASNSGRIEKYIINGRVFELYDPLEASGITPLKINYWNCNYKDPDNDLNITYGCKHPDNKDKKCDKDNQLFDKKCVCKMSEEITVTEIGQSIDRVLRDDNLGWVFHVKLNRIKTKK